MNKEIEKVIVYYEKEGFNCSVWIYMDKGERKIAVYSEPEQVTEGKYNYVDELKTFIRERIIDSEKKFESGSSSGNQDDQKLLWRIRIVFSDGERVSLSVIEESVLMIESYLPSISCSSSVRGLSARKTSEYCF